MVKRLFNNLAGWFVCVGLTVAALSATGLAADKTNYSGKYLRPGRQMDFGAKLDFTIEVVQNEGSVEVTRVEQGKKTTNLYPLDG
ncbi:MAG TPA: hypothetical protein VH088_22870 [Terriglobales bacterium]|jgi:hypothetical protein|nr:hypothetical protein [Terriglobales bacterium]